MNAYSSRRVQLQSVTERRPSRERGVVLVFSILLIFGVLAIGALTIDLGLAFLTQNQMQGATDAAALEALRFRDDLGDVEARSRAITLLGAAFDDDLDPDPLDPDLQHFGAGPIIGLADGVGETNAYATLSIPTTPVYKPNAEGVPVQLNLSNAPHGDIVAGAYYDDQSHVEGANYQRADFDPNSSAPDAFLVRLRRTHDPLGLDRVPGVSSAGPSLGLLFGLGSTVHAADPTVYNPRTDGITVRSTSIAAVRRAVRATGGTGVGSFPLAPLAIHRNAWNTVPIPPLSGSDFVVEASPGFDADSVPGTVGEEVAAGVEVQIEPGDYLIPIVDEFGAGVRLIIGFGLANLVPDGRPPATIIAQRLSGRVVATGVDARAQAGLLALAEDPALYAAYSQLADPVLAAVLVR